MELRQWAIRILSAQTLEEKLLDPGTLTDNAPGSSLFWDTPSRPPGMSFHRRDKEEKLPSFEKLSDPAQRAICLHRFCGHELLAVEIMAFALLAFSEAPKSFRKGIAYTLKEEQGHMKLYMDRMKDFGITFGDLPLYRHFWVHVPYITSPLKYVSIMNLTFEMANLDFAPMYKKYFLHHGDKASAALMDQIIHDEIAHVSFGHQWIKKFRPPELTEYESWIQNIGPFLNPKRARGKIFCRTFREKAGIPKTWIDQLQMA